MRLEETAMASFAQNLTEHNFGFPRAARSDDAELEGLYAMLVSLGLTKRMAGRLMRDFPRNGTAGQATVNFVTDGEGNIRVTIAQLDQEPSLSHIS
jgi:hypothetical protein